MVGSVHDLVFPPICYLSRKEDRQLTACTEYLLRKTDFSPDQLGLPADFCIPLPAAVVELAALDQRCAQYAKRIFKKFGNHFMLGEKKK